MKIKLEPLRACCPIASLPYFVFSEFPVTDEACGGWVELDEASLHARITSSELPEAAAKQPFALLATVMLALEAEAAMSLCRWWHGSRLSMTFLSRL